MLKAVFYSAMTSVYLDVAASQEVETSRDTCLLHHRRHGLATKYTCFEYQCMFDVSAQFA